MIYLTVKYLVNALGRRHCSLDSQASDILPSLLQQADQVIYGQHNVGNQLILSHAHITHSHAHTQHFLQLEFDGRLDFGNLVVEIFGVRDGSRKFARYYKS